MGLQEHGIGKKSILVYEMDNDFTLQCISFRAIHGTQLVLTVKLKTFIVCRILFEVFLCQPV